MYLVVLNSEVTNYWELIHFSKKFPHLFFAKIESIEKDINGVHTDYVAVYRVEDFLQPLDVSSKTSILDMVVVWNGHMVRHYRWDSGVCKKIPIISLRNGITLTEE